jgi:hypothetical protein
MNIPDWAPWLAGPALTLTHVLALLREPPAFFDPLVRLFTKGNTMPQIPQTVGELLADVDAVLTFTVARLPGSTVDEKKAAVNAFLNPRIAAELARLGASDWVSSAVVGLVDLAVDTEIGLHFAAVAAGVVAAPTGDPGTTPESGAAA